MFSKTRVVFTFGFILTIMTVIPYLGVAQKSSHSQSTVANISQIHPVQSPMNPMQASGLSLEQKVELLDERLTLLLALKDERIQSVNERSDNAFKLIQYIGALLAIVLAFFSIRDVVLHKKEEKRQRGIDEIVKDMMSIQRSSYEQQVRVGAFNLAQMEANPKQQT